MSWMIYGDATMKRRVAKNGSVKRPSVGVLQGSSLLPRKSRKISDAQ